MFPQTAFFHNHYAPNGGGKKLSDSHQKIREGHKSRGFVRLDSLDGSCHTLPRQMDSVDQKISPSGKESRWFDHQQPTFHHNQYPSYWPSERQHQQFYYQGPPQQFQVPFNLNKGQYEVWPMAHDPSGQFMQPQPSGMIFTDDTHNSTKFTRCVNYIFGTVGTVIASAFSSSSSLSSPASDSEMAACKDLQTSTPKGLNPNAKVFTPLNPNAKEFHPASRPSHDAPQAVPKLEIDHVDEEAELVTPPNEEDLPAKVVAKRKCTPWIPKGSVHQSDLLESSEDSIAVQHEDLDESDHEEEEEENSEDDEIDEDTSRSRLLSICSSEDNFIQFVPEDASAKDHPPQKLENCSKFLKSFLAGHDDDSDDEDNDDEDDADDGDWDSTVDAIFIDDEDILEQCGLQCQWMIQTPRIPSSPSETSISDIDQVDHQAQESHPNRIDRQMLLDKIQAANDQWSEMSCSDKCLSKVAFGEPLVTGVLLEDPDIAEDLQSSRMSELPQRRADKERQMRLLTPIFNEEHRSKMRAYIDSYLKQ